MNLLAVVQATDNADHRSKWSASHRNQRSPAGRNKLFLPPLVPCNILPLHYKRVGGIPYVIDVQLHLENVRKQRDLGSHGIISLSD